jgi:hypothetical protein
MEVVKNFILLTGISMQIKIKMEGIVEFPWQEWLNGRVA